MKETLDPLLGKSESLPALAMVGVSLDTQTRAFLQRFIESHPSVRLATNWDDYGAGSHESVADWLEGNPPDICLIDFDRDPPSAANLAERIHEAAPEIAIFAVSAKGQSDLIIQAMRSGCSEYLMKPVGREELLKAVARAGGRKRAKKDKYYARALTFIGAKGGCGVTTLVTQLGAVLAKICAKRTLLVDLHPNFGDAALHLGLTKSRFHSFDLIENADRLDTELLESLVVHHKSGLDLVSAPEEIDPVRRFPQGAVAKTLDSIRLRYEYILFDLPPGTEGPNLEFVRDSDTVYLVTVAEVSALRNVARYLEYLAALEIPRERIRVVVNRHHKRWAITDAQIEKVIHGSIFWKVPNQYPEVVKTINGGDPIAHLSSSEVMRSLQGWAETISEKVRGEKTEKKGFLRFLNP